MRGGGGRYENSLRSGPLPGELGERLTTMAKRLVIVALLGFAAVLLSAAPALAYNLEGPIWPGQPSSGCCAHISYRNFAGDSKEFNAGTEGANAWNNSTAYVVYEDQSGGI